MRRLPQPDADEVVVFVLAALAGAGVTYLKPLFGCENPLRLYGIGFFAGFLVFQALLLLRWDRLAGRSSLPLFPW